jgi:hypothetical protein
VTVGRDGATHLLAATDGTAFRLSPDGSGGLGYLVASSKRVSAWRFADHGAARVAAAPIGMLSLSQVAGRVFVVGPRASRITPLPAGWRAISAPTGSTVSSTGLLAVSASAVGAAGSPAARASAPGQPAPMTVTARISRTGRTVEFTVPAAIAPAPLSELRLLPGFPVSPPAPPGTAGAAGAANPATLTFDPDRSCSVPRNDPSVLTYQPGQGQVEWAVDQAVAGKLTDTRPANLFGSGLPAYKPQALFPLPGLTGGGTVPAPVMLGILAQESNEDQASPHAIIGQTGNFNPSFNWYGDGGDFTFVNWQGSDCGYGIAQLTTSMCRAGFKGCQDPLPAEKQLAVAVDYQANIAAGLRILEQDFNTLKALPQPLTSNGGDPKFVENWWFAAWAYNSGLEPNAANGNTTGCSPSPTCTDSGGHWGLGWVNNPANPIYPPDRLMFGFTPGAGSPPSVYNYNYDTVHPQLWSYEEKVIGFAAFGLLDFSYVQNKFVQAFTPALYPQDISPPEASPAFGQFCDSSNNCDPSKKSPCQLTTGPLMDHCWWHNPISWVPISCSTVCGQQNQLTQLGVGPADPGLPPGYAPVCSSAPLPKNAVIVGDVDRSIPKPYGCGDAWKHNGGTITWRFAADVGKNSTTYPSKIDFHQIGGGYGGHFWFTHSIKSGSADPASTKPDPKVAQLVVTGTWRAPKSVTGWTRIMAALPNSGAWDPEAHYQIALGPHEDAYAVINQAVQQNTWVDLGVYKLSEGASVSLNNVTFHGLSDDIAWGSMAFIHVRKPGPDYVAMGDSYSAGEGNTPFEPNTAYSKSASVGTTSSNSCHRSISGAYPRLVRLPGQSNPIAFDASKDLQGGTVFDFVACSGAETPNVSLDAVTVKDNAPDSKYNKAGNTDWGSPDNGNQGGENPQDTQGNLTPQTTLVTISIGGNDARFADILTGCILTKTPCDSQDYKLTRHSNNAVDPEALIDFEPLVIRLLQPHLVSVYTAIHKAAPNAEIIVLGYPNLFPAKPKSSCKVGPSIAGFGAVISVPVQEWLNKIGGELNNTIKMAVTTVRKRLKAKIFFVNPTASFAQHELCSHDPWIYPLVLDISNPKQKEPVVNPGSFHPTVAGQRDYAGLVNHCLALGKEC